MPSVPGELFILFFVVFFAVVAAAQYGTLCRLEITHDEERARNDARFAVVATNLGRLRSIVETDILKPKYNMTYEEFEKAANTVYRKE